MIEYQNEFITLPNRVCGVSPDALLDCFIGGLQLDIRRRFLAQSSIILVKVVALAKLFEKECAPPQKPKAWYATSKQYTSVSNL